ncbi:MAG: right-handed parallel beta-helix repeat-containing protein [Candidatus Hodarchaeales archaeon]|jgi:parallel beta-helix repeat protein
MRKSEEIKIIIVLITIGIVSAFSPISFNNPGFIDRTRDVILMYNNEFDHDNLEISAISGKIHINGNSGWVAFKDAGNCTGSGTSSDPYVIEGLVIDGGDTESCILIENSDVYFTIKNCDLTDAGSIGAGISLLYVSNGIVIHNTASDSEDSNGNGIYLYGSDNNLISKNILNNNKQGIVLGSSDANTVSGNIVKGNTLNGLRLAVSSTGNNISNNIIDDNNIGILFWGSTISQNNIKRNIVRNNNDTGIYIYESDFLRRNLLSHNCLINNSINAKDYYNNNWDDGIEGNYWDNYNGTDANNDGIGDTPFIMNGLTDNYPLINCPISTQGGNTIPGYDLYLLFGVLSVVIILINKKIRKSINLI